MLPEVDMEYQWGGHLCLSRNSTPVFGEIERDIFAAGCHNGLGVCKGTLGGMLIADLAMEQSNAMVDEVLALEEPKNLYPEPFMTMGARSYLSYVHWRAGREL